MNETRQTEPNSIVLRRAAFIIEVEGWTRGGSGMKLEGPKCVDGALCKAVYKTNPTFAPAGQLGRFKIVQAEGGHDGTGDNYSTRASLPVVKALRACLGLPTRRALYSWNDSQARSKQAVIKALRDCADQEEAAGR